MNMRNRSITISLVGTIMFLVVLTLLVSCSGGDGAGTVSGKTSARMIGTMPSDLAEEIDQLFVKANMDSKAPFLIGTADLGTLSEAERKAVKEAFDYDIPIVMVRPTPESRQALRSLVGLERSDTLDDTPDFWGLQTNKAYEIWEYVSAAPSFREVFDTDTYSSDDGVNVTFTDGAELTDYLFDESAYQLTRVTNLRNWLESAPDRAVSLATTSTVAKTTDTTTTGATDIMKVLGADNASTHFNYLHNEYAVNLAARSVYQSGNYFLLSANGILAAEPEYMATTTEFERTDYESLNRGRIAYQYEIRFRVPAILTGEVTEVTATFPKTVENVEEISDTFGWELGGKVTGGAECEAALKYGTKENKANAGEEVGCSAKVGIDLSGGVKASITKKFSVRDVKVENKSTPGSPAWLYTIPPPEVNYKYFLALIDVKKPWTFPKDMAKSTFQPEMVWVWKVSDSVRARYPQGLPVIVEFRPILVHCYTSMWRIAAATYLKPEKFTTQVTFPWPPTTAAKSQ